MNIYRNIDDKKIKMTTILKFLKLKLPNLFTTCKPFLNFIKIPQSVVAIKIFIEEKLNGGIQ